MLGRRDAGVVGSYIVPSLINWPRELLLVIVTGIIFLIGKELNGVSITKELTLMKSYKIGIGDG